jgi:hypothetical protein
MQVIFRRSNSKQGDGIVGILTGGVIDRTEYCEAAPSEHPPPPVYGWRSWDRPNSET